MPERPPREQLIRIATDRNAWPYQEQIEALLAAHEREIREQVAREIEQNIRTWEGMSDQATERTRGMAHAAAIARHGTKPAAEESPR